VNPDRLLPSLARAVRGLSALFWGLPAALLACTRTAVGDPWFQGGVWIPAAACGVVWYGLRQLSHFQPQERVWIRSVARAEIFALANLFLSPFTWWWSRRPANPFFSQSVLLLVFCSLAFLLSLNHVLRRLAALLPDETLRSDMRLFTRLNAGLIAGLGLLALGWTALNLVPEVPEPVAWVFEALDQSRPVLVVTLGLLPVALTMTLVWKAKEAIVADVFRGR
jgi:hypothetical protein